MGTYELEKIVLFLAHELRYARELYKSEWEKNLKLEEKIKELTESVCK